MARLKKVRVGLRVKAADQEDSVKPLILEAQLPEGLMIHELAYTLREEGTALVVEEIEDPAAKSRQAAKA